MLFLLVYFAILPLLRSNSFDPAFDSLSDELGVVIGPNVASHASQDEQIGQCINNFGRVLLSLHPDCKAFSAVITQDVERSECSAIISTMMHKVVRPNVVAIPRT